MAVKKIREVGYKPGGKLNRRIRELLKELDQLTGESEATDYGNDGFAESQLLESEKYDAIKQLENKIDRLLRLKDVLEIVNVSKSTWWAWVAASFAPAPIKLGRCTCWRQSEIAYFIENGRVAK